MKLEDLGYNEDFEKLRVENDFNDFEIGRIVSEHKERYVVKTEMGEYDAEITGNLRFSSRTREDFPAVGDWVALSMHDSDFSIIHGVLPRFSVISRQAVGKFGEKQLIAVNIDYALLIQALDRDFNVNRLERYLAICDSSRISPIIVLTKTDLIDGPQILKIRDVINSRIKGIPVVAISNESKVGYENLKSIIQKGKTYCMLGSSGVGKSTLMNNLSGKQKMKTDSISQSTHKGRHVTSHREMIILDEGGILIDNPGMREVGVVDLKIGHENTFEKIRELSQSCKFIDCTHTNELGCSVLEAVEKGEIDKAYYNNFLKLEKEKEYFESTVVEKRKKDKDFGKILKNFKKDMDRNKDYF